MIGNSKLYKFQLLIILSIFFGFQVSAFSADTLKFENDSISKRTQLNDLVVTGIRPEKIIVKNAVTLTSKDIMAVGSENFITVVDQLPGIVKITETTYPLIIRGMYGSRIHVEKDGMIKTGIDQSGYSLEDIYPNEVSDVQLLHGARSVAYGSGSVGGVLLINEKSDFKQTGFGGNARLAYGTNNNEQTADIKLRYADRRNAFSIGGRYTQADNFHYANDTLVENSAYTYRNLSAKYAHFFDDNKTLLEWNNNYYSGVREKPVGFQNNPYDYRIFYDKYNVESVLKLKTTVWTNFLLSANVWYNGVNTNQQQNELNVATKLITYAETRYSYKQSGGFRFTATKKWSDHWQSQAGIDGFIDYLRQDRKVDDFAHNTSNMYTYYSEQEQKIGGIYLINEYEKRKNTIGLSLRGDVGSIQKDTSNTETYKCLTGGVDWEYRFRPWLQNSISLSRHFRFPIPMEAVGVFFGGRGVFVGNPDIEPETSYNLEWILKGNISKQISYSANCWGSLFFNRITEYELFTYKYTYVNISKSRLFGFDGTVTAFSGNKKQEGEIYLTANASYSIGDDVSDDGFFGTGSPLEGIPPGRFRTKAEYFKNINKSVQPSAFVVFTYMSAYDRFPGYTVRKTWGQNMRPAYSLFDFGFNILFPKWLNGTTATLLVSNVFDTSYQPYGSYLHGLGRNFKLTINGRF